MLGTVFEAPWLPFIELPPVVAEVDGHRITAEQLLGRLIRCYGSVALDCLVKNALIVQVAQREGVTVTEKVKEELKQLMGEAARAGLTWDIWLRGKNLLEEDLREDLKYDLLLREVSERHTKVSQEEL